MNKEIMKLAVKAGIIFTVITVFFGASYYKNAELAKELLEVYLPQLEEMIQEDGSIDWIKLMLNNIFACAQAVGMGIVPLLFLPVFVLMSNAIMTGAIFGLGVAEAGADPIKSLVFGILPHGIFELTGLFISIALGFYLCRYMTRRLFRRPQEGTLLDILNAVAKIYVTVVLPLLIVASAIECFVTPEIMAWAGL